jgi:hypothetical protein
LTNGKLRLLDWGSTKGLFMAKRYLFSDQELLAGAKAIAEDLQKPGGGKLKLARIIDHHLTWFHQARDRGLEWQDIVNILFGAGVARPDGRPLSRGHLSSLVWRKIQNAPVDVPPNMDGVQIAGPSQRASIGPKPHLTQPEAKAAQTPLAILPEKRSDVGKEQKARSGKADLVDFMRRAAELRQGNDEPEA